MILCGGETLIDFIPTEARDGSPAYRPANGGSVHNVALTLGRLEVPVGFVGGISTDFFGDALVRGLEANGVSTAHVARLARPTTLAFVAMEAGEARYAFFDAEAADRHWRLEDMPAIGPDVTTLQFGGISLIRHPAAAAYEGLMEREAARRLIGVDANIRPGLVHDERDYRSRLDAFFRRAHVIKVSDADLAWIEPGCHPAEFATRWLAHEARLVLVTKGGEGAAVYGRNGAVARPAVPVAVADTVGAGDAFMGGTLAALHDRGWLEPARLDGLQDRDLEAVLDFALAVAAITCSRTGADPPRRGELATHIRPAGRAERSP
jgi:fructokinase